MNFLTQIKTKLAFIFLLQFFLILNGCATMTMSKVEKQKIHKVIIKKIDVPNTIYYSGPETTVSLVLLGPIFGSISNHFMTQGPIDFLKKILVKKHIDIAEILKT